MNFLTKHSLSQINNNINILFLMFKVAATLRLRNLREIIMNPSNDEERRLKPAATTISPNKPCNNINILFLNV